jgi:hypothetical protein
MLKGSRDLCAGLANVVAVALTNKIGRHDLGCNGPQRWTVNRLRAKRSPPRLLRLLTFIVQRSDRRRRARVAQHISINDRWMELLWELYDRGLGLDVRLTTLDPRTFDLLR